MLSFIQHNELQDVHLMNSQRRLDLLVVASFGMKTGALCEPAVRDLSLLLGAGVVLAHSNGSESKQYMYVAGKAATVVHEHRTAGGSDSELTIFSVAATEYRDGIRRAYDARSTMRQILFRPVRLTETYLNILALH
jgi:hypothetical protein